MAGNKPKARNYLAALCIAALSSGNALANNQTSTALPVIASFSIIADWLRVIGGERLAVVSLVPPDGDAHVFRATPAHVREIAAARLVFINGLGFEGWLERLLTSADRQVTVVTLSNGVALRKIDAGGFSARAVADPHAWHSVPNAIVYVRNIYAALCKADAQGCAEYEARTEAYIAELQALDEQIRARIASVPPERRVAIVSHDAFGYLAQEYGVRFLAAQGASTGAESAAGHIARMIQWAKQHRTPMFLENVADPRLLQQIGRETGRDPSVKLYSDALSGPHGPASTYLQLMRYNTDTLVSAMLAD